MANVVKRFFDERFNLSENFEEFAAHAVPSHAMNPIYCLGGLSFLSFIIQVFTGIILAMYYVPSTEEAYKSVLFIMNEVQFGEMVRSVHHWTANLMLVFVFLHMLRVYYTGSFKKPRELNWVAGSLLFVLTIGFGFTGYLLPWDQLSYWASVIGAETAASLPVIGPPLKVMIQGGAKVTGQMLSRFFVLHVMILPVVTMGTLVAHFIMVRIHGISDEM